MRGNTLAFPADEFDLDEDGDTLEPLPLDLSGTARVLPYYNVPSTGIPGPGGDTIDIGAQEYRRPADVAPLLGDGLVNLSDLLSIINHWGTCPASGPCRDDINLDGVVNLFDLVLVLLDWS
jgi:hypothetical protein